jgi:hypothetical protein
MNYNLNTEEKMYIYHVYHIIIFGIWSTSAKINYSKKSNVMSTPCNDRSIFMGVFYVWSVWRC